LCEGGGEERGRALKPGENYSCTYMNACRGGGNCNSYTASYSGNSYIGCKGGNSYTGSCRGELIHTGSYRRNSYTGSYRGKELVHRQL
jgi:hypothetical protein